MTLLEKKWHRGQRARKQVSREHRRTGLLMLVGLAVLVLGALAFFGVGRTIESALRADVQGVEQVEGPTGTEAPEIVADTSTKGKDEEEVAEEETTTADEETFTEEATEAEDTQLEDELAAKESAAEDEAASVPPDDPTLYLSVPKLGISGATVVGGDAGLELGGQLVGGYPWEPGSNTYIAGHRLSFPGTGSDHIFYNLPSMAPDDEVVLRNSL